MNKFPILGSEPKEYIPLDIIKQHEKQALRNHGQSLKRLAERGGLGWIEALCVLENREYDVHTKLTEEIAKIKVLEIIKKRSDIEMNQYDRAKVVENYYRASGALMEIGITKNIPEDLKELAIDASAATLRIINYINSHKE